MDTYLVQKRKKEMKKQLIVFTLMIFYTILAFVTVMTISTPAVPLVIMLLGIVQVIFQLYYFMHMKERNHGFPALFLYSGAFFGLVVVAALTMLV